MDGEDFRRLPPSKVDPFRDELGIRETYIFEVDHNLVASELRVLTGSWEIDGHPDRYGVGVLIFRGISEYAWMAEGWGIPDPPSW
jgi:asparagine synthetase B (glutamine-hydrolysing)